MSHPRQPSGAPAAASASAALQWVRKWYMDPQNHGSSVDIKGGATYTDDSGIAWKTSDGSVTGDSNASVLGVVANTALRVTTSTSTGNITLQRPLSELISDYAVTDRILLLMHMTAPTLPSTNDRAGFMWRSADDNWRHRIVNENTSGGNTRAQRRNSGSNSESNRRNAVSAVLGVEVWNHSSRLYYADTFPTSDPLTDDLTYTCASAFNIAPSTADPLNASTDELQMLVRRIGGTNFTIDILHAAAYRLEAVLA